jgi:hypothetical protein
VFFTEPALSNAIATARKLVIAQINESKNLRFITSSPYR